MKKTLSIISAIFALSIVSFIGVTGWQALKTAELRSCVNQTVSDIAEYSQEIENFVSDDGKWHVLSDDETALVFSNENIKIENLSIFSAEPQDFKERKLKLAIRKNSQYGYRIAAWSRGYDNISGTDDDIICSNCEKIVE